MEEQSRSLAGGQDGATTSAATSSRLFLPQLVPPSTVPGALPASHTPSPSTTNTGNPALPSSSPRVVRFSMDEVHVYAQWFQLDVGTVRDVVMQCKGNRELILATLSSMSPPRNKHGVSSSSSSSGALPVLPGNSLGGPPAAPPSRHDPPPSFASRRTINQRQPPPPALVDVHSGGAPVLTGHLASSGRVASPRSLPPTLTHSGTARIPHVPPSPSTVVPRANTHSGGGGGGHRSAPDRGGGRPDDESSSFRRATWHRERVMSIGALLAGANDDAIGSGGLRGLAAALQRDEESSRLWLEDEARTGAVRIWRRSLVWQMNQEHSDQCAHIAEETLARGTIVQRQEVIWYRLHVALVVGTEEMLRYRMLVDNEAASWGALTRGELQARTETSLHVLIAEEAWAWGSVFARALELTVAMVRLERSQVIERENIEYEWVQFMLQARGAGRQLRAFHNYTVAEQGLLWSVQSLLRVHVELLEVHQRRTVMKFNEAVVGDVVTLLMEPAGRAKIWQEASRGYAQILAVARFHRDSVVEFAARERRHRHSLAETEAASRIEMDAVIAYHALKARSAAKAAKRVSLRIPAGLFAVSQSLLLEWETSCREEIFGSWGRSAAQLEELRRQNMFF